MPVDANGNPLPSAASLDPGYQAALAQALQAPAPATQDPAATAAAWAQGQTAPAEQNATSGDPTDYTPQQPLPGTAATLQQLGSGHLAQDWANYEDPTGQNRDFSSDFHPAALAASAADEVVNGAHGVAGRASDVAAHVPQIWNSLRSGHALGDYERYMDPTGVSGRGLLDPVADVARLADYDQTTSRDPGGFVRGIAGSVYSGATLPGDVLMGRVDPASEEGRRRVFDTLGLMGGVGLPMAEEGAAGVAGGRLMQPEALEQRLARNAVPADGQTVHSVYIHPANEMWSDQSGFYIPPTGDRTGFKIDRAADFMKGLQDGEPFRAPQLGVGPDGLGFDDGRHRFSAMRDLGMETAPVSMDPASLAHARSLGLVAEDGPPSLAWAQHAGDAGSAGGELSLEDQLNMLMGKPVGWRPPSKFAHLDDALRDFVPPSPGAGVNRQPAGNLLDPSADAFDVFHGTGALQDFSRFDPGVTGANVSKHQQGALFFSPDPAEASGYARMGINDGSDFQGTAGPRVIPASVDPGRTQLFDLGAMLDARDPRLLQGMRDVAGDAGHSPDSLGQMVDYEIQARAGRAAAGQPDAGVPLAFGAHNAAIGMARQDGLDTAILRGLAESGNGDQLAVLTPGRVHSAIDGRLLYSGGIPGSVAALNAAAPPTQPDAGDPLHAALLARAGGQAPQQADPLLAALMASRR